MIARYYAAFSIQPNPTNRADEQGRIVEVDDKFGELLDYDDVAEILADNLNLKAKSVRVHHWVRLH
ncbi:MAG: hypothetical protein HKN70_10320 [Gammaproteobacteria bacterium]|nr:hypothetical protein [Gammaproteobacteria bacterium]